MVQMHEKKVQIFLYNDNIMHFYNGTKCTYMWKKYIYQVVASQ